MDIATPPTLAWLAGQGLSTSDLQAFALIHRRAGAITPWAAFTRELRLTESQAKTRAAHLERAGLCVREVVEDPTRRGPKEVGSRYRLTTLGRDLVQRLAAAWPEAFGLRSMRAPQGGATSLAPAPRDPSALTQQQTTSISPIDLTSLRPADRQFLESLPLRLRGAVKAALEGGCVLDRARLAGMGLDAQQITTLERTLSAIRERAGQGRAASPGVTVAVAAVPVMESIVTHPRPADESTTRVPAATLADDGPRATGSIPEARTYAEVANLVLAEVQARPAAQGLRESPEKLREVLPQIVWSCLHGCLADYGPPLKRVRTALRLLADGRWAAPRGMGPAFPGDFARIVQLAA